MVAESLLVPPTAAQVKAALTAIFNNISGPAKEHIKKRIKEWQTVNKLNDLYKKTKHLRQIKTIWQIEKEIDLFEFYCPSRIEYQNQRIQINDVEDFPYKGNLLVEGTVGQGKSIFFRFLASQELLLSRSIPAFVELRKISKNETLMSHLLAAYTSLGLDIDIELFIYLAKTGKTTIFLDAFDETQESLRTRIIQEIETLSIKYENLRIFVSSRPDSSIAASSFLRVVRLSPLREEEYQVVIRRLCTSKDAADEILKGVSMNWHVRHLLTTPLMIALLVFRYKADQSIPENVAAFYENLFELLLMRHDKTKPGFKRPRASSLGDAILQQIFEALCYLCRKRNKGQFSFKELVILTSEATKLVHQHCDYEKVLKDFISITCLILQEGTECRFIHKSVQEYYAATFISARPENQKTKFYEAMHSKWSTWREELDFLGLIDRYNYNKFLINDLSMVLQVQKDASISQIWIDFDTLIVELYGEIQFGYDIKKDKDGTVQTALVASIRDQKSHNYSFHAFGHPIRWIFDTNTEVMEAFAAGKLGTIEFSTRRVDSSELSGRLQLPLLQLATISEKVHQRLIDSINSMKKKFEEAVAYVAEVDAQEKQFEF